MDPKRRVGPETTDFVVSQFAALHSQVGGAERSAALNAALRTIDGKCRCSVTSLDKLQKLHEALFNQVTHLAFLCMICVSPSANF
jgi:hypothetical protein